MVGKSVQEMNIGDKASFGKTVSESDIYLFAGISGDFNPAHVNEEYAKETFFKTRIAHGMLAATFLSNVLGNRLPGPGTIYVHQTMDFLAPVRIGDTITAIAEVMKISHEKNRVTLRTTCVNQEGTMVLDGEAVVSPPKQRDGSGKEDKK